MNEVTPQSKKVRIFYAKIGFASILSLASFGFLFGIMPSAFAANLGNCASVSGWQNANFSCNATYQDAGGSGLASCQYRIDNNGSQTLDWTSAGSCSGAGPASLAINITAGARANCAAQGNSACTLHIKVIDASGNTVTDSSPFPKTFNIDFASPAVGSISPATATTGTAVTLSSSVSDALSGIASCNLFVGTTAANETDQGAMTVSEGVASKLYIFSSAGTYQAHATCSDNAGNFAAGTDVAITVVAPDVIAPTISSFSAVPANGTNYGNSANPNITIAWVATDTGGSGMSHYELWRALDNSGVPGTWQPLTFLIPTATSTANNPPSDGIWWYGLHAVDNASNCIKEDTSGKDKGHCGGAASDSLDTRTDRGPISVTVDTVAPTVGPISPLTANTGQAVTLSSSVSDALSGIASCNLFVGTTAANETDQGAMTVSAGVASKSYVFSSAGTYQAHATCSDNAGNPASSGSDVSVAASVPNYSLSVSRSGSGTVTSSPAGIACGAACSASYASGTLVTLTADAGSGYLFARWSGDCSGGSCTLTMNAAKAVAASFVDATAPSGGSISYANGFSNSTTASLTVSDGTDSGSGINVSTRAIQKRSASLSSGTCGTYNSFATISATGTYPNFVDSTLVSNNCYQYQYLVSDNAGNTATYSSSNTIKVDAVAPSVNSFSANSQTYPTVVNSTGSVTLSFAASDTGGSGLQKYQVFRATDTNGDGLPDWSSTPLQDNAVSPYVETPLDGTYWYGIHVLDNASNCIAESKIHCGGIGSDSLDGSRAVRGPIKVIVLHNQQPTAAFSCSPASCAIFNTQILTLINASIDPDNNIAKSDWALDSNSTPNLSCPPGPATCNYTPQRPSTGTHSVQLTVTDSGNLASTASQTFIVKQDALAGFVCSLDNKTFNACENFSGKVTQGEKMYLKDSSLLSEFSTPSQDGSAITSRQWQLNGSTFSSVNDVNPAIVLGAASNIFSLTVTDSAGRAATKNHTINVQIPFPTFQEISPF